MSARERLHAALDAILTKTVVSGTDYEAVIPISFLELAKEHQIKIHEDMTAFGVDVLIQVTFKDRNGDLYETDPSDTNSSRH
jgi:hypothetical protein